MMPGSRQGRNPAGDLADLPYYLGRMNRTCTRAQDRRGTVS
jgi:hypothetical protein